MTARQVERGKKKKATTQGKTKRQARVSGVQGFC